MLAPYRNYRSTLTEFMPDNEEGLEDLLQSAVRIAMEYRMDLMNNRAALYDAWRQIRVAANALKGILNLTISNNIYAPVASTNPFAFLSQVGKQFGHVECRKHPGARERAQQLPHPNHRLPAAAAIAPDSGRQSEGPVKKSAVTSASSSSRIT